MQELRLVGVSDEGDHLLLAATDASGAVFRVPLDARLRAAVRDETVRPGQLETHQESTVRPKEIQARIRSGQTPEEVAKAAGLSLAKIEAFANPVIRERMHVAELAQRTTVRRPGESGPHGELGELVRQRLHTRGVHPDDLDWDSWRREDGTWKIRLHYKLANRTGTAEWIYDMSARHVRPVDDEAAALVSATGTLTPEPEVAEFVERPRLAAVAGGAGGAGEAPHAASGPPAQSQEQDEAEQPTQPLRIARQSARNKRASVPSWDEIIFGTRRKD